MSFLFITYLVLEWVEIFTGSAILLILEKSTSIRENRSDVIIRAQIINEFINLFFQIQYLVSHLLNLNLKFLFNFLVLIHKPINRYLFVKLNFIIMFY